MFSQSLCKHLHTAGEIEHSSIIQFWWAHTNCRHPKQTTTPRSKWLTPPHLLSPPWCSLLTSAVQHVVTNRVEHKRRCTQIPLKNIFILNEGNKERASANRGVCNQYNQYSAIELGGFLSSSTTDWMQATSLLWHLLMSPATQRAEMKAGWSRLSRCRMSASSDCSYVIGWLDDLRGSWTGIPNKALRYKSANDFTWYFSFPSLRSLRFSWRSRLSP